VEAAMQLNPNGPGYFCFARCWNTYRLGKYEETLEAVAHANLRHAFHMTAIQTAALGQLGRDDDARNSLQALLQLRPDFATAARHEYRKWLDGEYVEPILAGLRKAGLDIPPQPANT
jgi:hypothetical protein